MGRQVAATLHDSADWKELADKLADPTFAAELQVLEASSDKLTRARYMELVDADTQLRERVREVTDATAAIGSLARKIERDIEHLGSEAARWPQRAKLARELEAPEGIQRRTETAGAGTRRAAGPVAGAPRRDPPRLRARRRPAVAHRRAAREGRRAQGAHRHRTAQRRGHADLAVGPRGVSARRSARRRAPRPARDRRSTCASTAPGSSVLLAALGAFMYVVLRQAPAPGTRHAAIAPRSPRLAVASALLCVVVFLAVLMPRGPLVVYRVVGIAAPLLAGIVATRTLRRADSRDRLDARVRRVRQRVSRRRGNEPGVRAAHARAAAAAVRRGARPRLAPRRARAVPARLAPGAGAPPRPAGAGHARRHRRRERAGPCGHRADADRPRRHRARIRAGLCGSGPRARPGVRGPARHAAAAQPAQRARARGRRPARAARGRRAVLLGPGHPGVHDRALRARHAAGRRQLRGERERQRGRRDDHVERDPLRAADRGRDLARDEGHALRPRPRDPAAAQPAHRRADRDLHHRRLRAGRHGIRARDGRARHRPHEGHAARGRARHRRRPRAAERRQQLRVRASS